MTCDGSKLSEIWLHIALLGQFPLASGDFEIRWQQVISASCCIASAGRVDSRSFEDVVAV
jgi:hypothetical protein